MAERIKQIIRKRTALKGEITKLRALLSREGIDPVNISMRFKRLSEQFHQFEELNLELDEVEDAEEHAAQFGEVQDSFYELSTMVHALPMPGGSRQVANATFFATGIGNSTFIERQKVAKLPIADLPKFDGRYEKWVSFKHEFKSMIDSRTDVDEVSKFVYLRSSLVGDAAGKLGLLDSNPESYQQAWTILTDLYERKRLLSAGHYKAILDFGRQQTASTDALSKMLDDTHQHIIALKALGFHPDEHMIICCLERALPDETKNDWQNKFEPTVIPTWAQFHAFLHERIQRARSDKKSTILQRADQGHKRYQGPISQEVKARKSNSGARVLLTNAAVVCSYCKQNHPTYRCDEFEKLNTQQRWDWVKAAGVCRNCLRNHKDPCKSSQCKKCGKTHHTLLHADKPKAANKNAPKPNKSNDKNPA